MLHITSLSDAYKKEVQTLDIGESRIIKFLGKYFEFRSKDFKRNTQGCQEKVVLGTCVNQHDLPIAHDLGMLPVHLGMPV